MEVVIFTAPYKLLFLMFTVQYKLLLCHSKVYRSCSFMQPVQRLIKNCQKSTNSASKIAWAGHHINGARLGSFTDSKKKQFLHEDGFNI